MNILLLGSGGRENALAWKLSQSPNCENLYTAPGNGGTINNSTNIAMSANSFEEISQFVMNNDINMLIVGPEQPLVDGIVDYFELRPEFSDLRIVGTDAYGAQLEGSKAFANNFMLQNSIPTAAFEVFTLAELKAGFEYIDQQKGPIVLKADGLAAGKGVVILEDKAKAKLELERMLKGKFGAASETVVIEEFLDGIELSVFVITDGDQYKILPSAKDYKQIGEGDTGLNTGGMGAISPVPFADEAFMKKVEDLVIIPTIDGIYNKEINYKGFLFFGLIKVGDEPFVIEYNCRLGDPETEVVLPRLKNDLVDLLSALFDGSLESQEIEIDERAAGTIMLVSGGYPEHYEKGKVITGIENVKDSLIFHAGTRRDGNKLLTNGGRVIAITSYGDNIEKALKNAKSNAELVEFEGKYYRKDIGFDL